MNYQQAEIIMEGHRANVVGRKGVIADVDPDRKKLGNQTYLCRYVADAVHQEHYGIVLFGNLIIDFYLDFLEINDHWWFGRTTHMRLNEYLPHGFQVWGTRYPYVSKPRPLGFVRTPAGVFPYKMPMTFNYSGKPTDDSELSRTDEAIAQLPRFIEHYLNALLECLPWEKDDDLSRFGRKDFAKLAVEFSDLQHEGLTIQEIVKVLTQSGAAAFSRVTNANDRARHMENVLIHGVPIPVIRKNWLRKTLRPLLHDYLIEGMGFDDVTWNRRDK